MRRAIWGVAASIVVVAVAVVAAVVSDDPGAGGAATVAAAGPSVSSTTRVLVISTTSSPTTAPPMTMPPMTTPPATAAAAPSTTVRPSTTTTPTTEAPATTVPETTTTTQDHRPPGPACAPAMFTTTVATGKASYQGGEPVTATATFTNTSGQACYWASTTGGWHVLDATGTPATRMFGYIGDAFRWVAFAAGDTKTMPATWDQRVCRDEAACTPAAPGRYTFVMSELPYGAGRATFDITL